MPYSVCTLKRYEAEPTKVLVSPMFETVLQNVSQYIAA